jgi:hypothetical protein
MAARHGMMKQLLTADKEQNGREKKKGPPRSSI